MIQPRIQDLISVISNIVVGVSAVIVTILGFVGLRQWRRELAGKTKFDVARRMAILSYQFRDEFRRARNPFTFPGESFDRKKGEQETTEETQILDEYFARQRRLVPLQDTLRKVYEASWEAEIVLDKDIAKYIEPLEQSFKELYATIEVYFKTSYQQARRPKPLMSPEWMESNFKKVYGTEDDEFSKSVSESAIAMVDKLKTYIS